MNNANERILPASTKQAIKSKNAQTAICDATIESLITIGYAKTSLNVVAKKAGFSKGALKYHFPSKEDLVTATANHLLERTDYKQQDKKVEFHSIHDVVFYIWNKLVNTPPYLALLEILIATRTDNALKKRISYTLSEWNKTLENQAIDNYQAKEVGENVGQLMTMTRSFLRGLILQKHYEPFHDETPQIERWAIFLDSVIELKVGDEP